jgi:hydrogenase-4 component B
VDGAAELARVVSAWLVVAAVVLVGVSGFPGLLLERKEAAGERIATVLLVAGSGCGLAGVACSAFGATATRIDLPWSVPAGAFSLSVDAISAMFLTQIFAIAGLGAVYGLEYWRQADHPGNAQKLRLFYGLMTAGMATLVMARNVVLFLAGWEIMALAAFLVVTTEDELAAVRDVGYLYLVATRLGTLCLFAMFALLHVATGTFDFGTAAAQGPLATAIFVLALAGFGLKAGIMPLHVWLPGAHANAPSHVSALMSGVLIKMGVYGLVRVCALFPTPPLWWGGLIIFLGLTSGVLGVAFAIGQHDVKRLLAYHSVENIGIICMGLGLAVMGRSLERVDLVALGLAGALLHVWNHGLFKALLFLSAGAVHHATGTREIDRLGGLLKPMPWTGLAFLLGAVAICGLPPLNGFVSELLIYLGSFHTVTGPGDRLWLVGALLAAGLALVGTLAVACFVKVFGVVFLGEARTARASAAHECGRLMRWPMGVLAASCLAIGVAPALVAPVLERAVTAWAPESASGRAPLWQVAPFGAVSLGAVAVLVAVGIVGIVLRFRIRHTVAVGSVGTWDCGYPEPTPRMQYSSSSFAQMLVRTFAWALWPDERAPAIAGLFPHRASFHSQVPDVVLDRVALPVARGVGCVFRWLRWVQLGSINVYLLYILLTLVLLLAWR